MGFFSKIKELFKASELTDDFYDDLLEILISGDLGAEAADEIVENVREQAKKQHIKTSAEFNALLARNIAEILNENALTIETPAVLVIVGVNGVGKTTAIGKLANFYKARGQQVVLAAGDTFRAAATEQLEEWANRAKVRIVKQSQGADPASVVFDAIKSAGSKNDDIVIVDTAGRLQNKQGLMEELKKIDRAVQKAGGENFNIYRLLVLDATVGQNALSQAELFKDAVSLDGIILNKLDGTAKGGIAVAIAKEFGLPILFAGTGEKITDINPFNAEKFAESLING
ncbi:MAG: signal recognition particle-docking protein FtsY [Christensenellaceae bacterium]|jgi:fused signal recognition particle receptor|nr:signal recognition particle-docking protein FtsY [Christensenellaceae bacterium]